jgi:glutamyl/glutaminyl-tRNA synthetase
MGASPAVFDVEKLDYYNGYYIRQKTLTELTTLCEPYLRAAGRTTANQEQLAKFVGLAQDRLKKLSDIVELTDFLFVLPEYDHAFLRWKNLTLDQSIANLRELNGELAKIAEAQWTTGYLETTILAWIKSHNYQNGDYLWPLRYALTGLKHSPTPFEVAGALGRTESLNRIGQAVK